MSNHADDFCIFARNEIADPKFCWWGQQREFVMVGKFAREAAGALLRWSRIADRDQAAGLIEKAADIKDRLEEPSLSKVNQNSLKAPDVET